MISAEREKQTSIVLAAPDPSAEGAALFGTTTVSQILSIERTPVANGKAF